LEAALQKERLQFEKLQRRQSEELKLAQESLKQSELLTARLQKENADLVERERQALDQAAVAHQEQLQRSLAESREQHALELARQHRLEEAARLEQRFAKERETLAQTIAGQDARVRELQESAALMAEAHRQAIKEAETQHGVLLQKATEGMRQTHENEL